MSSTEPTSGADREPGRVEIRVKGRLGARWSAWLDGLTLACQDDGSTLIRGSVVDQSALFGILQRLCDAALPLVSVIYIDPAGPWPPPTAALTASDPSTPSTPVGNQP